MCERFRVHKGDRAKVLVKMKHNSNSGSKQLKLACFLKCSNSQNDPPLPTWTAMASTSGIVDMTRILSIENLQILIFHVIRLQKQRKCKICHKHQFCKGSENFRTVG